MPESGEQQNQPPSRPTLPPPGPTQSVVPDDAARFYSSSAIALTLTDIENISSSLVPDRRRRHAEIITIPSNHEEYTATISIPGFVRSWGVQAVSVASQEQVTVSVSATFTASTGVLTLRLLNGSLPFALTVAFHAIYVPMAYEQEPNGGWRSGWQTDLDHQIAAERRRERQEYLRLIGNQQQAHMLEESRRRLEELRALEEALERERAQQSITVNSSITRWGGSSGAPPIIRPVHIPAPKYANKTTEELVELLEYQEDEPEGEYLIRCKEIQLEYERRQ